MAKIKQLDSGSYHASIYIGKDATTGKRKYKSFTNPNKKELKRLINIFELQRDNAKKPSSMTLETAMTQYINDRIVLLSPTTERSYDYIKNSHFSSLIKIPISNITNELIQECINTMAIKLSPKTIRNACGFLSAVMADYRNDFKLNVEYPKRIKAQINIPSKAEMDDILDIAEGTDMEIPILLASCMGLRRSEILGLCWQDVNIDRKTLNIKRVIVYGNHNKAYEKPPKTYSGTRTAVIPDMVYSKLKAIPEGQRTGNIVALQGYKITEHFYRMLAKNGLQHYRFHDLRHYFASVMCALGFPAKYAAARMGHADETMISRVYQHIMLSQEDEHTEKLNAYFK